MSPSEKRRRLAVLENIVDTIGPEELACGYCGHIAPEAAFQSGRGRTYGEHPEHHYCPECHTSINWYGYYRGRWIASGREECREYVEKLRREVEVA